MAYAILRFAKHKGGASKALSAHHERTKDSYASNPDIDLSRTAQNFHLVTPRWSYEQEIKHRIQTAGCRVRKDSVKFVDTLVTVSPEFAKAHEAEMPEYFRRAFDFLKERVGEENIISAVVHMDEKTPHMHLCFVPLTADGRLSAKAEKAGLSKILAARKAAAKPAAEAETVTAPPAEPCTASIPGIEVMDLEDAVQALWKAGIYAESGMGCTGPLVMMSEANHEKALEILKKAGYVG